MEQIQQLREMRDGALERLQKNPDFKLLSALDKLIVELQDVVDSPKPGLSVVESKSDIAEKSVDDAIEKMSAELDDFDLEEDSKVSFN